MSQLTILFLASNPSDMIPLNLAEEVRQIEQGLRVAEHGTYFDLRSQWATRADDLLQAMNVYRPAIVHFAGHGTAEGIYLLREGENAAAQLLSTVALQKLFALFRQETRLVLLNSCLSAEQAQAIVSEIECVVGMGEEVSDGAARIFVRAFYRALGFGWRVQEAFDQGVVSLLAAGLPDDEAPQIFCCADTHPAVMQLLPENHRMSIVEGNAIVGQAIRGAASLLQPAPVARKAEIATLYRAVASTLEHAVKLFEQGETPHGDCEKMRLFADEIYDAIIDYVGSTKAEAVRARLHAAHDVERALLDLNGFAQEERRRRLAELQRAAGYYEASAEILLGRE